MATKERHKIIHVGAHTEAGIARYMKEYECGKREAELQLCQYALNRIATLARYAETKPKKATKKTDEKIRAERLERKAAASKKKEDDAKKKAADTERQKARAAAGKPNLKKDEV